MRRSINVAMVNRKNSDEGMKGIGEEPARTLLAVVWSIMRVVSSYGMRVANIHRGVRHPQSAIREGKSNFRHFTHRRRTPTMASHPPPEEVIGRDFHPVTAVLPRVTE